MLVRFRVQYRDSADGRWRWVRAASSGWREVRRARESGWSFEVAGEGTQILRGVVDYRCSRRREGRPRARRVTEVRPPPTGGRGPRGLQRRDLPDLL